MTKITTMEYSERIAEKLGKVYGIDSVIRVKKTVIDWGEGFSSVTYKFTHGMFRRRKLTFIEEEINFTIS